MPVKAVMCHMFVFDLPPDLRDDLTCHHLTRPAVECIMDSAAQMQPDRCVMDVPVYEFMCKCIDSHLCDKRMAPQSVHCYRYASHVCLSSTESRVKPAWH